MDVVKFIPPFTVEITQEGMPARTVNLNKLQVQAKVEEGLQELFKSLGLPGKKMTKREEQAQVAYIRGAGAALQAVFGTEEAMTDFVSPRWVTSIWRGERIGGDKE